VVSCQLLVGAKHLEDKLSVIAKNSSPNASPVQLSVVSCQLSVVIGKILSPPTSPAPLPTLSGAKKNLSIQNGY
jgi:hypothetical protein